MKIKLMNSLVHEVLLSMSLYKRQTHLKYLTITKDWMEETKKQISKELHEDLLKCDLKFEDFSVLLIEQCPDKHDFYGYIKWLSELSVGRIYETFAPYESQRKPIPSDLGLRRDEHIELMTGWYKEYFSNVMDQIKLEDGFNELTNVDEIEQVSKGMYIGEIDVEEVVIVPSWHIRPLSLIDVFSNKGFITIPIPLSSEEETLLITKALSEKKRLDMIRLMKDEEKTFTELVEVMGMTKGNIHHHLLLLRSAGLLKMIVKNDHFEYGFRKERIQDLLDYLVK